MSDKEKTTTLTVEIDSTLKKQFAMFCKDLGIPIDMILNALITYVTFGLSFPQSHHAV